MKAKNVMSTNVVTVTEDMDVSDAVQLMIQRKISGLPVIDKRGKLIGIITEGDFLRRSELGTQRRRSRWIEFLVDSGALAEEYAHAHGRKIRDVMTRGAQTVDEDTEAEEIVRAMERHKIKRLPVMRGDRIVGIVARADLLRVVGQFKHSTDHKSAGNDESIRESILAELKRQQWAQTGLINVAVDAGVVRLSGIVTDERQRRGLVVAAENAAGVKQVNDDLIWVGPSAGVMV